METFATGTWTAITTFNLNAFRLILAANGNWTNAWSFYGKIIKRMTPGSVEHPSKIHLQKNETLRLRFYRPRLAMHCFVFLSACGRKIPPQADKKPYIYISVRLPFWAKCDYNSLIEFKMFINFKNICRRWQRQTFYFLLCEDFWFGSAYLIFV